MTHKSTEVLNDLLQGEISAVETYEQVLEKIEGDTREPEIRQFYSDHQSAVRKLQNHVNARFDKAEIDSGAWGGFAKAVTGTAKLFGDRSAVKALKEGEEHGLKKYQDALASEIDTDAKTIIQNEFIPAQQRHISVLDTIIDRIAS